MSAPTIREGDRLVGHIRAEVARRLSDSAATNGYGDGLSSPALGEADRAVLGRALIAEALQTEATSALRDGRSLLDAETEDEVAAKVFAGLFAMAGFQPYLEDPSIE